MSTRKANHLAPRDLMESLSPDNVDALLAFHRRTFGDARMDANQAPQKPEGVSDEEWNALGDPGKAAIVRERERATNAERELAAAKAAAAAAQQARPTQPTTQQGGQQQTQHGGTAPDGGDGGKEKGTEPDLTAIIQSAVSAAVAPLQQRIEGWEAGQAAQRITAAVTAAAEPQFYDTSDVLAQVDLASLTDGQGGPDAEKITKALEELARAKPHLVKPFDTARRPAPGAPIGSTSPVAPSIDDQVKARLQKMQQSTGIKLADAPA